MVLQRCSKDSLLEPMCNKLIPLVVDPWGHPTLKIILKGDLVEDKDGKLFFFGIIIYN